MNVSAVVPVYNSINTLERAIKSLLIQPEIDEIIIVDDGSSDGSFDLELELERNHSIIKVLTHEGRINKGASAARNLGLEYCRNEWVQFLDADDELFPEKVKNQLILVKDDVSLIIGNSFFYKNNLAFKVKAYKDVWSGLVMAKLGNTCANLWRVDSIKEVGGWNEKLINTQEYELMFRLLKTKEKVIFDPNFSTNIYYMHDSISSGSRNQFSKRENLLSLKLDIRKFLIDSNAYSLKRRYYFSASIGNTLRYHKTKRIIKYNYSFYLLYKFFKSITDRLTIFSK